MLSARRDSLDCVYTDGRLNDSDVEYVADKYTERLARRPRLDDPTRYSRVRTTLMRVRSQVVSLNVSGRYRRR